MLISFFLMIIISTSLTVPGQPSPRFHVEAWLCFRNREMDYWLQSIHVISRVGEEGFRIVISLTRIMILVTRVVIYKLVW